MSVDPAFGVDNFLQAKYYNESETVANNFLTLLFGKPGFYPSIPDLGLDIQSRMYQNIDNAYIEGLKNEIKRQCSQLMDFVDDGSFSIQIKYVNTDPVLLIILPVIEKTYTKHFAVGIKTTDTGGVSYNFTWIDN